MVYSGGYLQPRRLDRLDEAALRLGDRMRALDDDEASPLLRRGERGAALEGQASRGRAQQPAPQARRKGASSGISCAAALRRGSRQVGDLTAGGVALGDDEVDGREDFGELRTGEWHGLHRAEIEGAIGPNQIDGWL